MLWIDDLTSLDPGYLRSQFRPAAQGISAAELSAALTNARPPTREYLMAHMPEATRAWLASAPSRELTAEQLFQAQSKIVAVYFWEIVYRRHPEVYELFSQCQDMPLDDLFPPGLVAGRTVADVGTGTGRVAGHLDRYAARVHGFDPSGPLLEVARRKYADHPRLSFDVGSFSRIPLPDASVDVVVSCFAFQPSEERGGRGGLAEMRRVLRPGGVALIAHANKVSEGWLRAEGLAERVASRPIIWRRPADAPPLLDWLFRLSHIDFQGRQETAGTFMRVFSLTVPPTDAGRSDRHG